MKASQTPRSLQCRNVEAIAKVEAAVLGERSQGERLGRVFDPYPFNLLAPWAFVEAIVPGLLILTSQIARNRRRIGVLTSICRST